MKKIASLMGWIFLSTLVSFSSVFANFDRIEVIATPSSVKVGESVDLTLRALDQSGNVVSDYLGTVYILSESDQNATLPGGDDSFYSFKASDAWVIKFENGVQFSRTWVQDITIYDDDFEPVWVTEVTVTDGTGPVLGWNISIQYPETGITLWSSTIRVSGMADKNHKIRVLLNGDEEVVEGISNGEWMYEVTLRNVVSSENVIIAELLDADERVKASSSEVYFTISNTQLSFRSIRFIPQQPTYLPDSMIEAQVEATSGLWVIQLIIDDQAFDLDEMNSWTYVWYITTPRTDWNYPVDIQMRNELGLQDTTPNVANIQVIFSATAGGQDPVILPPPVGPNCSAFVNELEVRNIKTMKLQSKSVITWDIAPKATSYNIYKKNTQNGELALIENVSENRYELVISGTTVQYDDFVIKAVFKDDVCDIEGNASDMTRVQTGTKEIFLFLFAMGIGAGIFYFRRRQA